MIELFKIYLITVLFSGIAWWALIADAKSYFMPKLMNKPDLQRRLKNISTTQNVAKVTIAFLCLCPIFNIIFSAFLLFAHKEILKNIENRISN